MVKRNLAVFLVMVAILGLTGCKPVADAGGDKNILIDLEVTLDGSRSFDFLGQDLTYLWDFGDGSPQTTGKVVTHKYDNLGEYEVTLTVTNENEETDNDKATIEVIDWEELATPIDADGHTIEAPLVEFLPDGTMVVVEGNDDVDIEVAVETSPGSRVFEYVTSIPGQAGTYNYGSFVEVIDADEILVGTSDKIHEVYLDTGDVELVAEVSNYDAILSGDTLYFTWAVFNPDWTADGFMSSLDITDPDNTLTDLVTDIPGASAGICLDEDGNIYTGNGYSNYNIPNETGLIKSFALEALPLTWDDGNAVGDVLSAGSLIWAEDGVMLVGGGDVFGSGDANYFAALDTTTQDKLWELDPDPGDESSYKLSANKDSDTFAASIWNYPPWGSPNPGDGTIYLLPFSALGL